MVISVFGLGFVGLTTAVSFADKGNKVYGIDVDADRKELIKNGKLPFHEPGLDEALLRNIGKNFEVTEDPQKAVSESECVYFCVGTPYGEGGQADLRYLYSAIDTVLEGKNDRKYRVLVTKSTIPPSTTKDKIIPYIESKGVTVGTEIGVANNPEFLREGHCWDDVTKADRIVLGVSDEKTEAKLLELYGNFTMPKFCVSLNTGEFIKYLSNALLATLISYANEMSVMADTIGDIDTAEAFRILLMDGRWNGGAMKDYVYPGCGYGGYCLPKDTNAIYSLSRSKGFDPGILKNVITTNEKMPRFMTDRIEKKAADKNTAIGILGLSFKPGSDDTRDTPAAKVIKLLIEDGYTDIVAYDPMAEEEFRKYYGYTINYAHTMQDAIENADIIVILTAWDEFRKVSEITGKTIVDCRYML
jgi:UDPglucose 6-dehydrogenase